MASKSAKAISINSKLQHFRFLSRKTIKKSKRPGKTHKPTPEIESEGSERLDAAEADSFAAEADSERLVAAEADSEHLAAAEADLSVTDLTDRLRMIGGSKNHMLLFLRSHERAVAEGSFSFKLLRGCIDILGFTVTREDTADTLYKFSSLPPHSLIQIIAESPDEKLDRQEYLSFCSRTMTGLLTPEEINEISTLETADQFSEYTCVLAIFKEEAAPPLRIWSVLGKHPESISFSVQGKQIINNMIGYQESFPKNVGMKKIIVVGDRNTGKSTFCILLMNSLLTHIKNSFPSSTLSRNSAAERTLPTGVCLLDCDLGQGMFFPPGSVTLHKFTRPPSFSNLAEPLFVNPELKFFLGEFSPENNPKDFLDAVKRCVEFHRSFHYDCPLVINTHGFVTNLGENILYDLIRVTEPYFVVNLKPDEGLGRLGYSHALGNMSKVDKRISFLSSEEARPLSGNDRSKSASKLRGPKHVFSLQSARIGKQNAHYNFYKKHRKDSYIMHYLRTNRSLSTAELPFVSQLRMRPLAELSIMEPACLQIKEYKFILMKEGAVSLVSDPSSIANTFIGSLVALFCAKEERGSETLSTCSDYGFGFITDFDRASGLAYVCTPLDMESLNRVNTIAKSAAFDFSKKFYGQGTSGMWELVELFESMAAVPDFEQDVRQRALPFFLDPVKTTGSIVGAEPFQAKVSVRNYQK